MASRRVRVTGAQWAKIEPLLPRLPRTRKGGRPWAGNRAVIDGILWVLKTGARWCDLPAEYPSPSTCWRRLRYGPGRRVKVNSTCRRNTISDRRRYGCALVEDVLE